jgi:RND family efflux transporter MFP subunit
MNSPDKRRSLLAAAGIIAVTTMGMVTMKACQPQPRKAPPQKAVALPVEAVAAQRGDFRIAIPSQGIVQARTQSTLAAQVAGNIVERSLQFAEGGAFRKGDWLLKIDDRDYKAALKLAEANLTAAEVSIKEELARAEQAKRDWDRLNKNEKANDLVLRKPQLAAARSQLSSRQAQLDKARLDVERTRIVAPYDGRVLEQSTDTGDYVTPGRQLGRIAETTVYEVRLPVSASWREFLQGDTKGNDVTLHVDINGAQQEWHGQVVRTSADINASSRQLSLIAEVKPTNTHGDTLLIGDFVKGRIQGRMLHNVVALPRTVLNDGEYVWIVRDNALYKREVTTVWQDEDTVIISEGLENGELVNLTPLGPTISGTPVKLIDKKSAGNADSTLENAS